MTTDDFVNDSLEDGFNDLLQYLGVQISVNVSDKRLVGTISHGHNLSVLELFAVAFTDTIKGLKFFEDASSNPLNFAVNSFTVDLAVRQFSIVTRKVSTLLFEVIPQFLSLSGVTAFISVTVSSNESVPLSNRLNLETFQLCGAWQLGNLIFTFEVTKDGNGFKMAGRPDTGTLDVAEFIGLITAGLLPNGLFETGLTNEGLGRFSLKETRAILHYNKEDGYAVGVTGRPTIEDWSNFSMSVIYHKYAKTGRGVVTLAADVESFMVSDLIRKLSGFDITMVPVLGKFTIPKTKVIFSTGVVDNNFLPELIGDEPDPIQKGVNLVARARLHSSQEPTVFHIHLTAGGPTLGKGNNDALVDSPVEHGNNFDSFLPLHGLPRPLDVSSNDCKYTNYTRRKLTATVNIRGTIELIPRHLRVRDLILKVEATPDRVTILEGTANWFIGSEPFPLNITPVTTNDKKGFLITGKGQKLSIADMVSAFGAQFIPTALEIMLDKAGVKDFLIRRPKVQIPIGSGARDFDLYFTGEPVIRGLPDGVAIDVVVSSNAGASGMALGFEFANTSFADLVGHFTGKNIKGLPMFDRSLRVGIIVSKKTLQNVRFQGKFLGKLPIRRGITMVTDYSFPSGCGSDNICEFCKKAVGSTSSLRLRAVMDNPDEFLIAAEMADIKLGDSISLTSVGLQVKVGQETSIGLAGEIKLNSPPIILKGALRLAPAEILVEMAMQGTWKRPFGINYLAVTNMMTDTRITLTYPPILSKLKAGGEVLIGQLDSGKELRAKVYLGIDLKRPEDSFFYGNISTATMSGVLEAFGLQRALPFALSHSEFPRGLTASYSMKEMKVAGQTILAGFRLSGALNILGLSAAFTINVKPPNSFLFEARLGVLNLWEGAFKMCATKSCSDGPILYASIAKSPRKIDINVQGYVKLFGMIEQQATVVISNTELFLELKARLFCVDAHLSISADVSTWNSASVRVHGRLSGKEELKHALAAIIQSGGDAATRMVSKSQEVVDHAQQAFDESSSILQQKLRESEAVRENVTSEIKQYPGCTFSAKCLMIESACSDTDIPIWLCALTKGSDFSCVAEIVACVTTTGINYIVQLLTARKAPETKFHILDVERVALQVALTTVNVGRSGLEATQRTLEAVKSSVKAGVEAASDLVKWGVYHLVDVKEAEFHASLSEVESGLVMATITVQFPHGCPQSYNFSLNLESLQDTARHVAEKIYPGIIAIVEGKNAGV